MRAATRRRDWSGIAAAFAGTDDPDLHAFYTTVVGTQPVEDWLRSIVDSDPGPLPRLLYARRCTAWAWQARGTDRAKMVSRKRFQLFHQRLALADQAIGDVLALDAGNRTAWWLSLVTARGLGLSKPEASARFERLTELAPEHLYGHYQRLQQLAMKWGGSHVDMHRFAMGATRASPAGSPLGSLVAMSHIEQWLAGMSRFGTFRYFKQFHVRRDLHEAADRSVRHPDFVLKPGQLEVLNQFAMAFSYAGERSAARDLLRRIRRRTTEYPWAYVTGLARPVYWNRRVQALLIP